MAVGVCSLVMLFLVDSLITPIAGFQEPFSSMSHLLGAGLFAVLAIALIHKARGNTGRVFVASLFAFTVVLQLSMSGVYHLLGHNEGREVMQRLDHAAIFTLIAGTITFVHAILFRGFLRWGMIVPVWVMAATAITLKTIFFHDVAEWLSLMMYLGLGWLGAVSGFALWRRFGFDYMWPILAGGLAYTIGAVFEFARWPWLIDGVVGPHELFHVAVLVGIACHWYFAYGIAGGHVDPVNISSRTAE